MSTNAIENDHRSANPNADLMNVNNVNSSLLNPKSNCNIGTWNVQTMYSTCKTAQIVKEMGNYQLDILGISECRWTGSGKMNTKNDKGESYTIIYSGQKNTHHRGVALIMNRESANTLIEWEPINERLIKARFNSKYCKLTIIQCYAPTNDSEYDMKEEWYDQLQAAVSKVPQHDVLLIMGDMNAKTGSDSTDRERAMGREGCGIINDNGEKFVNFCLNNNCVIGGTIFQHKEIHKLTWKSPDGRTVKILNTKSKRMQEHLQKEYSSKDKEIKRSARQDKRAYVDKLAEKAETAAQKTELSTVYRITKQLCRHTKVAASIVKDKDGNALTTEQMQAKRWAEHFTEVLNTEAPTITADPPAPHDDLDIATGVPTLQKVTHAIKQMKTGKSPGIENICIELLKTDVITAGNIFTGLFSDIWTANEIPRDWNKGLIVKIPKKGDLQNCENWRGITLLSMPSKIFCRVLLNRIEEAIDVNLRQEQAGFRRGKGCMDQIFSLRNIIEQSTEWNAPLCSGFYDWKIYSISNKSTNTIQVQLYTIAKKKKT